MRKPWGQGVASLQKERRNQKARLLASILWERLDPTDIDTTGQLFPRGSLKTRANYGLFIPWACAIKGRVMTNKLATSVCRRLVVLLGHSPPRAPGQTYSEYIWQQAQRLRVFVRKARKMALALDPTQFETQPLPPVPWICSYLIRPAAKEFFGVLGGGKGGPPEVRKLSY